MDMRTIENIQSDVIIRIERELCRSLHEPEVDFVKRYVAIRVNKIDEYIANCLKGRFDE